MATGLYIAMDFKPGIGGIAEHTHQMSKHLIELGERITVLTPSIIGGEEFDRTCGYHVIRFDRPSATHSSPIMGLGRFVSVAKMTRILFLAIKRVNPDYLILDQWDALTAISILLASKLMGIPYFLFAHRYEFAEKRNWIFFRKMIVRSAARVIAVSNYTCSLVLDDSPKRSNIDVIHNGFNYREIDSYRERCYQGQFPLVESAFPERRPSILSVSRLVEWKHIDRVIEAMPRIVSRVVDAQYIIVGDGEDEGRLKCLAMESPVKKSITFLGPMTGDEKFECFRRCDVFALPSEGEAFGIVFVEAMGFAKPVVAGQSGGPTEFITHAENGFLVDSNNVDEIANAIIELLEYPETARALGENGKRRVESELNWKTTASKFLSVIDDVVDKKRKQHHGS